MIVTATGFIPLSQLSVVSTIVKWESSQWKEYCADYWLKELQESMDRYTGHRDITEVLLKTALNTIQSINQSQVLGTVFFPSYWLLFPHHDQREVPKLAVTI